MKLCLSILLVASCANAATYYASTNGSDLADGSIGSPWRTVKKAIETISSGDIVQLRSGWFIETDWPPTWTSGGASSYKTLMSYPGEVAILSQSNNASTTALIRLSDVSYWVFRDMILDNSLAKTNDAGSDVVKLTAGAAGASRNIFSNCVIRGSVRGHGFLVNNGSTNNTITYCTFSNITSVSFPGDSPPHCIYLQAATNIVDHCLFLGGGSRDFNVHNFSTEASGTVVRYCVFGTDNRGIGFVRGDGCLGYNNLFTNGPSNTAISIGDDSYPPIGSRAANNSIYGFSTGISVARSTNAIVENNLVGASTTEGWAFSSANATNATFRNNILDTGFRGFDSYGKTYLSDAVVSFLYTNAVGFISPPSDLRISASSFAVDRGVSASGFADDFSGAARPFGSAWDIGAYEYLNASQIQTANIGTLNLR